MKDLTRQRNWSETAPSTDEAGHDTTSVFTKRETSPDVSKRQSPISPLSMKSNRSRGEPPTFSCDPLGNRNKCECPDSSPDDLHKPNDVGQTSENKAHLPPEQYSALERFQRSFKLFLKQKNQLRITEFPRVSLTDKRPPDSLSRSDSMSLSCSELFRQPWVRTVLTTGVAGVGKSVLVQRTIVDWCEDRALQDVQLLCPVPVPQLHLLQQQSWSLMELLQALCPRLRESGLRDLSHHRVLFILDGLDQCRLPLDFSEQRVCDPEEALPLPALLSHLLSGHLLPRAQLWVVCRPEAARSIPSTLIHRSTEVRGFILRQQQDCFLQSLKNQAQQEARALHDQARDQNEVWDKARDQDQNQVWDKARVLQAQQEARALHDQAQDQNQVWDKARDQDRNQVWDKARVQDQTLRDRAHRDKAQRDRAQRDKAQRQRAQRHRAQRHPLVYQFVLELSRGCSVSLL